VAVYLLGHAAFRLRLLGGAGPAEPIAALAAVVLGLAAAGLAAWLVSALLALLLLALVCTEAALSRAAR
jgi:hypothetical protein